MGTVVLAGSPNDVQVAVIDFTNAARPSVVSTNAGLASGCVVDLKGSQGVLGALIASGVRGINVGDPAAPSLGPTIATGLAEIATVAVQGDVAAVVEADGQRVILVDLTSASILASTTTQLGGGGGGASVGFLTPTLVAQAGGNDSRIALVDFGPSPATVTYFTPGVTGAPVLQTDGGLIAVGDSAGLLASLFDSSGTLLASVPNALPNGTASIGLSGRFAVYGTTNATNAQLVDFNAGISTPFDAHVFGGATANCAGTICVCGGVNTTDVAVFDFSSSPPVLIGSITNSNLDSVGSVAIAVSSPVTEQIAIQAVDPFPNHLTMTGTPPHWIATILTSITYWELDSPSGSKIVSGAVAPTVGGTSGTSGAFNIGVPTPGASYLVKVGGQPPGGQLTLSPPVPFTAAPNFNALRAFLQASGITGPTGIRQFLPSPPTSAPFSLRREWL
jgi:hypothetical protein